MPSRKQNNCAEIASAARRRFLLFFGAAALASCSSLGERSGPQVYARVYQADRSLFVSVTGLRPGERVTGVALVAADGSRTVLASGSMRQRNAGEPARGRGATISSNEDGSVTFGSRVQLRSGGRSPPRRLSLSGEAEARLPLESAIEVAANPGAYSVQVEYLDGDGVMRVVSVTPRA